VYLGAEPYISSLQKQKSNILKHVASKFLNNQANHQKQENKYKQSLVGLISVPIRML